MWPASEKSLSSPCGRPISWSPTGRPVSVRPQGIRDDWQRGRSDRRRDRQPAVVLARRESLAVADIALLHREGRHDRGRAYQQVVVPQEPGRGLEDAPLRRDRAADGVAIEREPPLDVPHKLRFKDVASLRKLGSQHGGEQQRPRDVEGWLGLGEIRMVGHDVDAIAFEGVHRSTTSLGNRGRRLSHAEVDAEGHPGRLQRFGCRAAERLGRRWFAESGERALSHHGVGK